MNINITNAFGYKRCDIYCTRLTFSLAKCNRQTKEIGTDISVAIEVDNWLITPEYKDVKERFEESEEEEERGGS